VTLWNPAAEQIFGWRAEEVLGQPYPLIPDEKLMEFESLVCAVFTGHSISNLRSGASAGTDAARHRHLGGPLYDPREIVACMGMLADVSEKTQLELQLVQAQKLESIGQLAAGIAHEINTPPVRGRQHPLPQEGLRGPDRPALGLRGAAPGGEGRRGHPELVATIEEAVQEADFEYLTHEIRPPSARPWRAWSESPDRPGDEGLLHPTPREDPDRSQQDIGAP